MFKFCAQLAFVMALVKESKTKCIAIRNLRLRQSYDQYSNWICDELKINRPIIVIRDFELKPNKIRAFARLEQICLSSSKKLVTN